MAAKKKAAISKKKAASAPKKAAPPVPTRAKPAARKAVAAKAGKAAVRATVKSTAKPAPAKVPARPAAKVAARPAPAKAAPARSAPRNEPVVAPAKAVPAAAKTKTATKPAARPAPAPAARAVSGKRGRRSSESFQDFVPYREKGGSDEYMSPPQVEHFRHILSAWRQQLMEEVDRTVHHMQDDAGNFPDPNDRATQEEEFALELRTRDRERKLIKKINESLAALDSGEYGYCEMCGVEIGVERLEARPTATLCIDCKTLDEIREKQRA